MRYSHSNKDMLIILADAFRGAVDVMYAHETSHPENLERPVETFDAIHDHLVEQYPVMRFYDASYPMDHILDILMQSDYFNAANKNDTVDMIEKDLKILRNISKQSADIRLASAKFVLELLSSAYEQVGPR